MYRICFPSVHLNTPNVEFLFFNLTPSQFFHLLEKTFLIIESKWLFSPGCSKFCSCLLPYPEPNPRYSVLDLPGIRMSSTATKAESKEGEWVKQDTASVEPDYTPYYS